jgi:hypothetical protein
VCICPRVQDVGEGPALFLVEAMTMATKLAQFLGLAAVLSSIAVGCSAAPQDGFGGGAPDEGDVGSTGELSDESSQAVSIACKATQQEIKNAITNPARKTIVTRGFSWWNEKVPYSQTRWYEGYRTDCSGFVSMAWQLGASPTTASFYAGTADNHVINYDNLLPGDALVRRASGSGHIVLFLGWDDAAKTRACVLEQASTSEDMEFRVRTRSSMGSYGYRAVRRDGL